MILGDFKVGESYVSIGNVESGVRNVTLYGKISNVCFRPLVLHFPHSETWEPEQRDLALADLKARLKVSFNVESVSQKWIRHCNRNWSLAFVDAVTNSPVREEMAKVLRGKPPRGIPHKNKQVYVDMSFFQYGVLKDCMTCDVSDLRYFLLSERSLRTISKYVADYGRYPSEVVQYESAWLHEKVIPACFHSFPSSFHVWSRKDYACVVSVMMRTLTLQEHIPLGNACFSLWVRVGDTVEYQQEKCSWGKCGRVCSREETRYNQFTSPLYFRGHRELPLGGYHSFLHSSFLRCYFGGDIGDFSKPDDEKNDDDERLQEMCLRFDRVKRMKPSEMSPVYYEELEKEIVEHMSAKLSIRQEKDTSLFIDSQTQRFLPYSLPDDPNFRRVLSVSGSCGCGKTWFAQSVVKNALDKGQRVLYICPRVTLVNDFMRSLEGVPDVASYKYSERSRKEARVLVTCYHSVGRIINIAEDRFDVVVFDEVLLSELSEFNSEVIKDRETLEHKLAYLMMSCSLLLLLDAEINPFVSLFLASFGRMEFACGDPYFDPVRSRLDSRPIVYYRVISPYNPVVLQDRRQFLFGSVPLFLDQLANDLRDNKRCALFVSNKSDILSIKAVIRKTLGPLAWENYPCLVLTADEGVPKQESIGHLCDREKVRLVIFSSVVSVGSSIDTNHYFDSMYALVSSDHVTALALRQACERVRVFKYLHVCIVTGGRSDDTHILTNELGGPMLCIAEKLYKESNKARDVLKFDCFDRPRRDAVSFSGVIRNAMQVVNSNRGLWGTLYVAFSSQLVYRNRTYCVQDTMEWDEETQKIWDTSKIKDQTDRLFGSNLKTCLHTGFELIKEECVGVPSDVTDTWVTLHWNMHFYDYRALCSTFQLLPEFREWKDALELFHNIGLDPLHDLAAEPVLEGETKEEYEQRVGPPVRPKKLLFENHMFRRTEMAQFGLADQLDNTAVCSLPQSVPQLYESLLVLRLFHARLTMPREEWPVIAQAEHMILLPRLATWRRWAVISQSLVVLKEKINFPLCDREEEDSPFDPLGDKSASHLFKEVFGFSLKDKAKRRALFCLYNRYRFKTVLPVWDDALQVDGGFLSDVQTSSQQPLQDHYRGDTPLDTPSISRLKRKYEAQPHLEEIQDLVELDTRRTVRRTDVSVFGDIADGEDDGSGSESDSIFS